jgi:cysteinyl-tRNA synthetase
MTLQVYSTLTRRKEPFHKQPGEWVTMYVCGPTVYKPSHIGHMVGPVIFDTVKRYLTHIGYEVTWVVNITDVDDKLIVRAKELGTTVPALAETMTADYVDCLKKLNVTGIDKFPKATEHIPGMIAMMERLIAKGYAYPAGGDVYFDVSKDADYGKLCNRDPEQLEAGARIEVSGKKRNPGDFALWKGAKPDEPAEVQYDSPWGKGRPGWHIECSAMSQALLGDTLDIHGGGLDLQFPHHENELAQSESDTGKEFAHTWMHNGLLSLRDKDGKLTKMAGSLGNVLNVTDALKHMGGEALRFFFLSTHYRSPIDLGVWDWKNPATPLPEGMVASKKAFDTFVRFAERVERVLGEPFAGLSTAFDPNSTRVTVDTKLLRRFHDHMADDFNTGGAVGVLFELVGRLNKLADDKKLEEQAGAQVAAVAEFRAGVLMLKEFADILGLTFTPSEAKLGGDDKLVGGLMQLLLDLRANLRATAKEAAKDNPLKKALFDQTDLIRTRLADLGVTLEDRPAGTSWRVG